MRILPWWAALLGVVGTTAFAAPHAGDVAPDVVGYDFDGQRVRVSAYEGRVVVVSFWASWCGPCRKELPLLEGMQKTVGPDRLKVIAVNVESPDVFEAIRKKSADFRMTFASDPRHEAQKAYGVSGIPHLVIVGRDGRILQVHRGYSDDAVDDEIKELNEALR